MTGSHYGDPCFVNLGKHVNIHSVNYMVGTAIDNDTLYIGQCCQLGGCDIVRVNFTIYTQSTNGSGKHGVFGASQIQDNNHILFHSVMLFLSY